MKTDTRGSGHVTPRAALPLPGLTRESDPSSPSNHVFVRESKRTGRPIEPTAFAKPLSIEPCWSFVKHHLSLKIPRFRGHPNWRENVPGVDHGPEEEAT